MRGATGGGGGRKFATRLPIRVFSRKEIPPLSPEHPSASGPAGMARVMIPLRAGLAAGGRWVLDRLLPPRCLLCGADVLTPGSLCADCWPRIRFLTPPWCATCGQPFAVPMPEETRCAACLIAPPPFACARAAFAYDIHSRPLITRLKYADRPYLAPALAGWLLRVGGPALTGADAVIPVPLPRYRLFLRRYNQAALLAVALVRAWNGPSRPRLGLDWLVRTRPTPPQAGLGLQARQRNVAGAFAVRPARLPQIAGARLLLLDDVLTTGATVRECSRTLLAAGAARVEVLTVARVLLDES